MKTATEIIKEQASIINEVEIMLKMQQNFFSSRLPSDLEKLKIQQSKVRGMIEDTKKPIPTLR
jgi:hypothetical protein